MLEVKIIKTNRSDEQKQSYEQHGCTHDPDKNFFVFYSPRKPVVNQTETTLHAAKLLCEFEK